MVLAAVFRQGQDPVSERIQNAAVLREPGHCTEQGVRERT